MKNLRDNITNALEDLPQELSLGSIPLAKDSFLHGPTKNHKNYYFLNISL
jgi:hypothetical protein